MRVEQAVFTSRATDRALGYQLVARSPGISETDARALSQWGPSHDALGEGAADDGSVSFFSLPSGRFCISLTVLAGSEYSGRGCQVFTRMLVADRSGFGRFACNPLALLHAAIAQGAMTVDDTRETFLPVIQLPGRAAAFDPAAVETVLNRRGAPWLARLVGAAINHQPLAVLGAGNPRQAISAILNCLPVDCRPDLTFTTGLRFSPRRPFRVTFLPDDLIEARRLARAYDVNLLLAVDEGQSCPTPTRGWAPLLLELLGSRDWEGLRQLVSAPAVDLHLAGLDEWAEHLRHAPAVASPANASTSASAADQNEVVRPAPPAAASLGRSGEGTHRRAHAAHRRPTRDEIDEERLAQASQVLAELASSPADILGSRRPDTTAQLERLDDTVFEAIAGKQTSLEQLKTLWPEVLAELGEGLVEESRLQYLRHALGVWKECVDGDEIRQSGRAMRALEVLCLLFDESAGASGANPTTQP